MIYARKKLTAKRGNAARVRFTNFSGGLSKEVDEGILPLRYATVAYNCRSSDGALKNGAGAERFSVQPPHAVVRAFYYRRFDHDKGVFDDRLLVFCEDGKIYWKRVADEDAFQELGGVSFVNPPEGICYRLYGDDVILLAEKEGALTVWDGKNEPYTVKDAPKIASMCVHYERLFATVGGEKTAVWFSDDLDPTNWDVSLSEAGFIEMVDSRGGILRAVSFLDYVYLFRSYGIARLSAYADQTQFTLTQLFVSSGKIFPESVTVCGDRILFLAEDGLYAFDGLSTRKILEGVFPFLKGLDQSASRGAFYNGKYYLTANFAFPEGEESALLEYVISDGSCSVIRGVSATDVTVVSGEEKSMLVLCVDGMLFSLSEDGKFDGSFLNAHWTTPFSDLGTPERLKHVRFLFLQSDHPCTVTVETERGRRKIPVVGAKCVKKYRVGLVGRMVKLTFESEGLLRIAKPSLEVETYL